MGTRFRHFEGLSITLSDLRSRYGGQSGLWQAFAAPRRDETAHQAPLGYYQGVFDDVLRIVLEAHPRAFLDEGMCGEIVPIVPERVRPSVPPKDNVLSLLQRALEALDSVPGDTAPRAEAEAIRRAVGALEEGILAEVAILKACADVPPPILLTLLGHPSPQLAAWAKAVLTARENLGF